MASKSPFVCNARRQHQERTHIAAGTKCPWELVLVAILCIVSGSRIPALLPALDCLDWGRTGRSITLDCQSGQVSQSERLLGASSVLGLWSDNVKWKKVSSDFNIYGNVNSKRGRFESDILQIVSWIKNLSTFQKQNIKVQIQMPFPTS